MIDIDEFWKAVIAQDAVRLRKYFKDTAYVNWHCTNEHFTVDEYIKANCEYPGNWGGKIERKEIIGNMMIVVVNVYTVDKELSFHVVSFLQIEDNMIIAMDEYWGDDGSAPQWRLDKHIGKAIR